MKDEPLFTYFSSVFLTIWNTYHRCLLKPALRYLHWKSSRRSRLFKDVAKRAIPNLEEPCQMILKISRDLFPMARYGTKKVAKCGCSKTNAWNPNQVNRPFKIASHATPNTMWLLQLSKYIRILHQVLHLSKLLCPVYFMSLCLSIRALLTSEDLRGKFLRAAQILDPEWMEYKEANSSLNISTLNAVSFVHFVLYSIVHHFLWKNVSKLNCLFRALIKAMMISKRAFETQLANCSLICLLRALMTRNYFRRKVLLLPKNGRFPMMERVVKKNTSTDNKWKEGDLNTTWLQTRYTRYFADLMMMMKMIKKMRRKMTRKVHNLMQAKINIWFWIKISAGRYVIQKSYQISYQLYYRIVKLLVKR